MDGGEPGSGSSPNPPPPSVPQRSPPPVVLPPSNLCSSRSGCDACAQPVASGQAPCFYCYDSNSCNQVSSSLSPLGSCKSFTFTAGDCQCMSSRTTCGECAEIAHLGCVWANMTTNLTLSFSTHSGSLDVGMREACMVGNGTGPTAPDFTTSWTVRGQSVFIALASKASSFYWGQCMISGATSPPVPWSLTAYEEYETPVFITIVLALLVVTVLAVACTCNVHLRQVDAARKSLIWQAKSRRLEYEPEIELGSAPITRVH